MRLVQALAVAAALFGAPALAAQVPPAPSAAPAPRPAHPPVILVSIDGFRADYLDRHLTPTLQALANDGVRSRGMHPSFPSLTFPNHYTLVTGLRPDHHGIVENTMEDPAVQPDSRFTLGNYDAVSDRRWWDEATPIWVTAKRQGLRTATLFWPGSEAPIQGVRPDLWTHFDATITPDERVDIVLGWLDLPPEKRPDFLTLYFDQVDHEGHEHGPDSSEVNAAMGKVDAALARLTAGLKARGLFDSADIVIVADHGMAGVSPDRIVWLEDAHPPGPVHVVSQGSMAGLNPEGPGGEAALDRYLRWRPGHVDCRRKADLPTHLHYGTNPRIPQVVCLAETGWLVLSRAKVHGGETLQGEHGYDPTDPRMDALFIAHGPAFRRGRVEPKFDNVDVYPVLAHLLGVPPEPNDGRLDEVEDMLAGR